MVRLPCACAPKAPFNPSPGRSPGDLFPQNRSPERAPQLHGIGSPFQGSRHGEWSFPGLRPGLGLDRAFGAQAADKSDLWVIARPWSILTRLRHPMSFDLSLISN